MRNRNYLEAPGTEELSSNTLLRDMLDAIKFRNNDDDDDEPKFELIPEELTVEHYVQCRTNKVIYLCAFFENINNRLNRNTADINMSGIVQDLDGLQIQYYENLFSVLFPEAIREI